jgi:hypothetical protein
MSKPATMRPRLRKLMVFLHVTSSVGWVGAAVSYLGLCVLVVNADSAPAVSALYNAMAASVTYVILPFGVVSFVTGMIVSLGTVWGLFRHYWVIAKLVINLISLVVLIVYTQEIGMLVQQAEMARTTAELAQVQSPGIMSHVLAGVVILLAAVWLAIDKPRGQTRAWRRKQGDRRRPAKRSERVESVSG